MYEPIKNSKRRSSFAVLVLYEYTEKEIIPNTKPVSAHIKTMSLLLPGENIPPLALT